MDPMTQTVVRYVLMGGFSFLASHTGQSAWADPSLVNIAMTAITGLAAAGVAAWGIYRSTVKAKVSDLAASPQISAIHTTPAVAASVDDPKVKVV